MKEFLLELGIKLPDLVSGFFGGIVNAFIMRDSRPWSVLASVIVGAVTANYFAELISKYLGLSIGPAGFIVGLTSMVLCQQTMRAASRWTPFKNGDGNGHA